MGSRVFHEDAQTVDNYTDQHNFLRSYHFHFPSPRQHNQQISNMQEQSCIIEELPADEEPAASTQQAEYSNPTAGTSQAPPDTSATAAEAQRQGPCTDSAADQAASGAAEPSTASSAAESGPSSSSPPEQEQEQQQPADAEQVQQLLDDCERLKQEGNAAYTRGDYDEALQLYWQVRAWPSATAWTATSFEALQPAAVLWIRTVLDSLSDSGPGWRSSREAWGKQQLPAGSSMRVYLCVFCPALPHPALPVPCRP